MINKTTGLAKEAYDVHRKIVRERMKSYGWHNIGFPFPWAEASQLQQSAWVAAAKRVETITRRNTLAAIKAAERIKARVKR